MPYDSELPNSLGHVDIVKDSEIAQDLGELVYNPPDPEEANNYNQISPSALPSAYNLGPPIEHVYGVDGSRVEVTVGDRRLNKRVGFIDVALVRLDMGVLQSEAKKAYVTPSKVRDLGEEEHIRMVLPSSNTLFDAETTHESWRKMTYRNFREKKLFGLSLFDLYYELLERRGRLDSHGRVRLEVCPAPDCNHQQLFVRSTSADSCPKCGITTYPTDALRVHERVSGSQSNEAALNVLMGIIEHLVLLRSAHRLWMNEPSRLEKSAFIKDGPLAQFDTAAWIHQPIHNLIWEFKTFLRKTGRSPLVYAGIHKTGEFAAYAQEIRDYLSGPCVLPLSNEDIYEYVMAGDRTKDYGYKTYYGKNFIYKSDKGTETGHCLPFLVPRRYEEKSPGEKKGDIIQNPEAYDELARTITILERVRTIQYPDSLIPLVLAHEAASLPEDLSRRVLGTMAQSFK